MKIFATVAKILAALAAIAGIVYIIATYGDKIVAWAKGLMGSCQCHCGGHCHCGEEDIADETPVDEAVEEVVAEELPADETVVDEAAPVAEETDFEG